MAAEILCPICKWMGYDEPMEQLELSVFPGIPIWLKCPVCPLAIPYPVATYCINIAQARRKAKMEPDPSPDISSNDTPIPLPLPPAFENFLRELQDGSG